jgi:hypothetical protein
VRFKDVETSDLGLKTLPLEKTSANYRLQRVNDMFYAWGAAVGDFNHDGVNDIAAGPYYYLGPDFTKSREIYAAQTINPSTQCPSDCMQAFAADFTGDGWTDVAVTWRIGAPLHLFVNPERGATSMGQVRRGPERAEGSVARRRRRWRWQARNSSTAAAGSCTLQARSSESYGRVDRATSRTGTVGRGPGLGLAISTGTGNRMS